MRPTPSSPRHCCRGGLKICNGHRNRRILVSGLSRRVSLFSSRFDSNSRQSPPHLSTQGSLSREVTVDKLRNMREIVHIQAGQCGNQIGAKVGVQGILGFTIDRERGPSRPLGFCSRPLSFEISSRGFYREIVDILCFVARVRLGFRNIIQSKGGVLCLARRDRRRAIFPRRSIPASEARTAWRQRGRASTFSSWFALRSGARWYARRRQPRPRGGRRPVMATRACRPAGTA